MSRGQFSGILGCVRAIPFLQPFLGLILLSFLIFGLDKTKFLSLPKTILYTISTPIQFGLYSSWQNISRQFYFITSARFAAQENKALKEQIGQIISENASLRSKLAEVEAQLVQEQSLDPRTYNLMAARPIGVDRYLKLDKGKNDGILVGQSVVYKDNFIGQVIESSEKGANVRLLADPSSKLLAFSINREGKARGILIGQFGSEMLFDKISHEEIIAEGDLVYSEGTEGYLPRGLILGRVTEVEEKENEIFKRAKVRPIFDIRELELVFVIKE